LCGIQFVKTSDYILPRLRKHIDQQIFKSQHVRRFQRFLSLLLFSGCVAFIGYVVWTSSEIYRGLERSNDNLLDVSQQQSFLTQSYAHRYHAAELKLSSVTQELLVTRQLYQDSQVMLSDVSRELEATRGILQETEFLLAQTRSRSEALRSGEDRAVKERQPLKDLNLEEREGNTREFANAMTLLEERNKQVGQEIQGIENKLDYLQSDAATIEEAQTLRDFYKDKLKGVKARIKHFKREAKLLRKAALAELDHIKAVLGNNGFLVKDGENVLVDQVQYKNLTGENVSQTRSSVPEGRKFSIDVRVFQ
jgi:hypothetical protein